jgi:hypothetical protein
MFRFEGLYCGVNATFLPPEKSKGITLDVYCSKDMRSPKGGIYR